MFAIGSIKDLIWGEEELKDKIEAVLIWYVLPDLSDENPFIKARACWMYDTFGSVEFKDPYHV